MRSLVASLCEDLRSHVPGIVEEWQALIDARARRGLATGMNGEDAPELTRVVLDAALCAEHNRPAYEEAMRALVRMAAYHGSQARAKRLDREALFLEYEMLREAVWRHVRTMAAAESGAAIVRVDDVLSVAVRASLQGYHRWELEEAGRWGGAMDVLLREALELRRPPAPSVSPVR